MPEKKNQHFVPKMYLKLFGNPDDRSIGVFNIKSRLFIPEASIADQASKPWFYDRDGTVEDTFGVIEGRATTVIREVLQKDRLPRRFGPDYHRLITFFTLQRERTQAAVAQLNERTDKYVKAVLRHDLADQDLTDRLDRVKITRTDAVATSLLQAHLGMPLLFDLDYKLIVNVSGRPFLISDAPVILHNRLFEGTGAPATGYASVGLQVIFPIGPWRAILFYDDAAYGVGSRASATVRLVNPAHAARINDLQWEAVEKNLYVSPATNPEELYADHDRWQARRPESRILLNDIVVRNDAREKRVRLGVGPQPSIVDLNLPFSSEGSFRHRRNGRRQRFRRFVTLNGPIMSLHWRRWFRTRRSTTASSCDGPSGRPGRVGIVGRIARLVLRRSHSTSSTDRTPEMPVSTDHVRRT